MPGSKYVYSSLSLTSNNSVSLSLSLSLSLQITLSLSLCLSLSLSLSLSHSLPSGPGDSGSLEVELLSLHSQLYQLETQQAQLASAGHHDDGTMLQLVMEISSLQQQASHMTVM